MRSILTTHCRTSSLGENQLSLDINISTDFFQTESDTACNILLSKMFRIPYHRKLSLVLIKVFEINAT